LSAAGWRVAVASASTPLAVAWQQLHRPVGPFEAARRFVGPAPAGGVGGDLR
jgi:hypothetical protein